MIETREVATAAGAARKKKKNKRKVRLGVATSLQRSFAAKKARVMGLQAANRSLQAENKKMMKMLENLQKS